MLLLTSTSDIVRVTTGSSAAVDVHASWVDNAAGTITPGRTNTANIATATTTTVVASPASSTQRNVKNLTITNTHASTSTTIVVEHFDGTTAETLWSGTLLAAEAVIMGEDGNWIAYSSSGIIKGAGVPLTSKGDILIYDTTPNRLGVGTDMQVLTAASSASSGMKWATPVMTNKSTATVSAGYAADTYLAGSPITMPAGGPVAGTIYHCMFDMVKTAAGTATFIVNVRYGTNGTTADTAIVTYTFTAGTAAADTGKFDLWLHFRTVGSGTAAVVVGTISCNHHLAATGLITLGASGYGQITTVSSGFNSTPASSILGLSVNGGASFSGTNTIVETQTFNLSI